MGSLSAQLALDSRFGEHILLQRGGKASIWGKAQPGKAVKLVFANQKAQATADANGNWEIVLPSLPAGGPYPLSIRSAGARLQFDDILVGDLYLASGQSNMEWHIKNGISTPDSVDDQPLLRYAKMARVAHAFPQDTATLNWQMGTQENSQYFSTVAYFFARKLIREEGIPIGIIENSIGGSPVQAWTSAEMLAHIPGMTDNIGRLQELPVPLPTKRPNFDSLRILGEPFTEMFQREVPNAVELAALPPQTEWKSTHLPQGMEHMGLVDFDGSAWFRKRFWWEGEVEDSLLLKLGKIDDYDHTFFNGTYVASGEGEEIIREYALPSSLLKQGENIVLVKMHDRAYRGGMTGPAEEMLLQTQSGVPLVSLAEEWSYFLPEGEQFTPFTGNYWNYFQPTVLYNGLIHPILNIQFKGIIWYQGESDSGQGFTYRSMFPQMIEDWRIRFRQGHLPFLYVQLANFQEKGLGLTGWDYWADVREAQEMALRLPNTAMITAIDLGEADDIHPKAKQPVGERLAAAAQDMLYGKESPYAGPRYASHQVVGDTFRIHFDRPAEELVFNQADTTGFIIAGIPFIRKAYSGRTSPTKALLKPSPIVHDKLHKPIGSDP